MRGTMMCAAGVSLCPISAFVKASEIETGNVSNAHEVVGQSEALVRKVCGSADMVPDGLTQALDLNRHVKQPLRGATRIAVPCAQLKPKTPALRANNYEIPGLFCPANTGADNGVRAG